MKKLTKNRVAIQGYPGAFHEVAARLFFRDEEIEVIPADTFEELVEITEEGKTDLAIMAIENTLAGTLMYNYNILNNSGLKIAGEVYLRIKQNLLALPGVAIEDLQEVHSHPMAIAQSRAFFKKHPHIHLVETIDTALSAKKINEGNLKNTGAIASKLAAEMYGLDILAAGIETNKRNYTRFIILKFNNDISNHDEIDKVSLCFSLDHAVGSLHKVLAVLSAYNANLTKIQSAPIIGKPWEYRFFVDFVTEGIIGYKQAIEAIKPITSNLKIMGAYQKGNHYEY